jgi:L-seryl-tRNA(Ser) seleniumtransferase
LDKETRDSLRKIPSMDKLLDTDWARRGEEHLGRSTVKAIIAEILEHQRRLILKDSETAFDAESIAKNARNEILKKSCPSIHSVVNATGVVIHTNLGRSCMAREAVEAAASAAASYSTLEYEVEEGVRGNRNSHVEWLICRLTGAEAAIAVNNNAGAVILALSALAKGREAVISRGELVEIGGSFRIPDIMSLSGTVMIEVGTTNCTHLYDYEGAINEETSMLLKVHPSNYRITGFSSSVSREDLAELAHENGLVFMEDLGSGLLFDVKGVHPDGAGLSEDPSVMYCLKAGVDIVTFSGDKLLGGPQAGIVAGSAKLVNKLRRHPLARALRMDKMTLAALEATLRLYMRGDLLSIPTPSMFFMKDEEMLARAEDLAERLKQYFATTRLKSVKIDIVTSSDAVGGGAFPQKKLKGYAVKVSLPELGSAGRTAQKLRTMPLGIIPGLADDALLFHVRTLLPGDTQAIVSSFESLLAPSQEQGG